MTLELPVKIIKGPDLDEILNMEAVLIGNLDTGALEVSRKGADLPFKIWPWQRLREISGGERGKLSKKKFLYLLMIDNSKIEFEILGKSNIKEIIADVTAFKNTAESKFPKGGIERAVESLQKAKEAFLDAVSQVKGLTIGKLATARSSIKTGINKISKKED